MTPTHRVLGRSPRDGLVECIWAWKKRNRDTGADYRTLTIRGCGFNSDLSQAVHQNDAALQAVIPRGLKDVASFLLASLSG